MKTCLPKQNSFFRAPRAAWRFALPAPLLLVSLASAADTNAIVFSPALPDVGASVVRVMGALALVLALFLGGVWCFRNWQRLSARRGNAPRLNVLEVRSLGGRQSVYVMGYQSERFLIASSPNGVNFLTHLPAANEEESAATEVPSGTPSFAEALKKVLKGK